MTGVTLRGNSGHPDHPSVSSWTRTRHGLVHIDGPAPGGLAESLGLLAVMLTTPAVTE